MYRKFFAKSKKINKKTLILLSVLLILVIVGGYFYLHQDARTTTINKIKDYFSNARLRAHIGEEIEEPQLTPVPDQTSSKEETQDTNEELTNDALSLEGPKEVLGQETTTLPEEEKLTLEEIAERVNNVSKKVVLVSIQVQILSLEDISSQITEDENIDKDTLEQISKRVERVSEQVELIRSQLELLSSQQS